jgi:hypothetical protein
MMMLIAWISTALALTPGGFRHDTAQAVDSWAVRDVLIYAPDSEIINQITPRITKVWGSYALDAEISAVMLTGPGGEVYWGLGSLRTGHGWIIHNEGGLTHRLGAELLLPVSPDHWRSQAFGSSAQDTLATMMGQLVYRLSSSGDSPSELRLSGGVMHVPYWTLESSTVMEAAYVHIFPLSDAMGLVVEAEVVFPDQSPLNLRPMMRFDLDSASVDVGLQVPIWGYFLGEGDLYGQGELNSVQLLSQYRGRF